MHKTGELVRQYRIVRRIGRGGMGDVYEAEDETLRRRVALKTIRAAQRPSAREKARFLREARILSQLDHPGICRIHDYIEGEDRDHLVLEFIRGRTLSDLGFPAPRRLDLIEQLLAVMVVAHGNDIIHRDLKPDNVMVTDHGQLKVLDFGLARPAALPAGAHGTLPLVVDAVDSGLTLDATYTLGQGVLGTPAFMSPEQAAGEPASPASDMYSCGLVIHFLLSGDSAYPETRGLIELLDRVREADVLPLTGVDADLADLVAHMTRRSPGARPTAEAALRRLRWIRRKPARRNRRLLVAAVALVVLGGAFKYTTDLRQERARAEVQRAKAEDLLGFMLGDLRSRLDEVGRLDIMDGVGNQATAYFADREPGELRDADAERYIRTLNLIGGIRMERGQVDSARVAYGQALVLARQAAARRPETPAVLALLGETEFWAGSVEYAAGNLEAAFAHFQAYYRLAMELVAMEPDSLAWRQEVAYAQTTLAEFHRQKGERGQAIVVLAEALETKRLLLAAEPANADRKTSLANSLAIMAEILSESHRPAEAARYIEQARRLAEAALADDPRNVVIQSRCSTLLQLEGLARLALGDVEPARELFGRDLALTRGLVERDPENKGWRDGLSISLASTANAAIYAADLGLAGRLREEWVELWAHTAPPASTDEILAYGAGVQAFARLDIALGRFSAARADLAARLADLDAREPLPASLLKMRLRVITLLMAASRAGGRPGEFATAAQRFAAAWDADPDLKEELTAVAARQAWAHWTGQTAIEQECVMQLEAAGYAHPARGWLLGAVGSNEEGDHGVLEVPGR